MIGLVEHRHLDRVETAEPLLDEVFETTRTGHHDVGSTPQGLDLGVLADTAVDRCDLQTQGRRKWCQHFCHLICELARGNEDKPPRAARLAVRRGLGDHRHDRNGERDGLAAAGLAPAEDVTTRQRIGQRGTLDGERRQHAGAGQRGDEGRRHAERRERRIRIDDRGRVLAQDPGAVALLARRARRILRVLGSPCRTGISMLGARAPGIAAARRTGRRSGGAHW